MFLKMKEGTISVFNVLLSVSKCLNVCKTQQTRVIAIVYGF